MSKKKATPTAKQLISVGQIETTIQRDALATVAAVYTECTNSIINTLHPGKDKDFAIQTIQVSFLSAQQSIFANAKNMGGEKLPSLVASELQIDLDAMRSTNASISNENSALTQEVKKLNDYIDLHVRADDSSELQIDLDATGDPDKTSDNLNA